MTGHDVVDLAKKFEEYGLEALVYTDIGRDGMMSGVNIEATFKLAQAIRTPIIASGGLHNIKDVQAICAKLVPEGVDRRDRRARALRGRASTSRRRRPPPTRRRRSRAGRGDAAWQAPPAGKA